MNAPPAAAVRPGARNLAVYVDGGRVGDMLSVLPGLRALRRSFPDHRLSWVTGHEASSLNGVLAPLAAGLVDDFLDHAGIGARWSDWVRRPLAERAFDIVIDCQTRVRTSLCLKRLRHREFITAALAFQLSARRPPGRQRPPSVLDRFMQLVSLATGRPCEPVFDFELPAGHVHAAAALLPDGASYVGLAPGAGGRHKCWPLERFIELADRARADGQVPVFLLGPKERDWREAIAPRVPSALFPESEPPPGITPSPILTIALARRLSVAVANDSGTGHMLGTAGCPLVSLFGPSDPSKFRVAGAGRWRALSARAFGSDDPGAIPVDAVRGALRALRTGGGERGGG